jgi:uncharacterized coiled-coil protein SlyX
MIDLSISLGNLLTMGTMIVVATGFIWANKMQTRVLEIRMELQEKLMVGIATEMSKIEQILIALAQAAGRMDRIEDHLRVTDGRIEELRTRCIALTTITRPHPPAVEP